MESSGNSIRVASRALALAIAFALGTTAAPRIAAAGNIIVVTNCNDTGAGSLRNAAASAVDGGTIDLSGLDCGTIALETGEITFAQQSIYLQGPGAAQLTISGGHLSRVFRHTGLDGLVIRDLTIADGKYQSQTDARGGCILSSGNVVIDSSSVRDCTVAGGDQTVSQGGGIYSFGNVTLVASRVTGNVSYNTGTGVFVCEAGGVFTSGDLSVKYSTIDSNQAVPAEDGPNSGSGGAVSFGSVLVFQSTISNNASTHNAGIEIIGGGANAQIIDSTVSGNRASSSGGVYSQSDIDVSNSTIAFNYSTLGEAALYAGGVTITLQSTIVAENYRSGGLANDLGGSDSTSLVGSNNIVGSSTLAMPIDTITDCPRLGSLDDHGGPTLTHAPLADSVAIDAGNDVSGLDEDQRGGERVLGAAADVGAIERRPDDSYGFHSGFEARCGG